MISPKRSAETSGRSFKASMHRSHGAGWCGYLAIHGGRQGQDDQGNRAFSRQWRQCHQRSSNSWPWNCYCAALAYPALDRSRPGRTGSRSIFSAADSSSRHLVRDARASGENAHVHRFPGPTPQGGALVVEVANLPALTSSSAPRARWPCGRSRAASLLHNPPAATGARRWDESFRLPPIPSAP